jgi:ribosomal protein L40E
MSRRHLHNLSALLGEDRDVERVRDEYLASLDADDGLTVLLISSDEILAAASGRRPPVPHCERCGARLSRKRHRCSRCGLRHT